MSNKVWLFYLKSTKELYAYTSNKEYKKMFLSQRCVDCFHVKKQIMDDIEFSCFMNKNKELMLVDIPLNTHERKDVSIIGTYQENESLIYESEVLENYMESMYIKYVLHSNLKKEYKESIKYLTTTFDDYETTDRIDRISRVDLFHLFVNLFKNTFTVERENDNERDFWLE